MSFSRVHWNGVLMRAVLIFPGISQTQAPWRALLFPKQASTSYQDPLGLNENGCAVPCSIFKFSPHKRDYLQISQISQ